MYRKAHMYVIASTSSVGKTNFLFWKLKERSSFLQRWAKKGIEAHTEQSGLWFLCFYLCFIYPRKKKSPIEHLPSAWHLLVTDSCFVYMAWLWFGGLEERGWELLGGLILQYLFPGTKWSAGLADCFMMLLLLRAVVPGRCSKESLWLAFVGTKSLVSPGHWTSFTSSWTGLPTKLKVWEKESTHEGDFERNSSLLIIERFGLESPYRSSRPALMPWWWVIAKAG